MMYWGRWWRWWRCDDIVMRSKYRRGGMLTDGIEQIHWLALHWQNIQCAEEKMLVQIFEYDHIASRGGKNVLIVYYVEIYDWKYFSSLR